MRSKLLLVALLLLPTFAETIQDCADLNKACVDECNKICNDEKYTYCREFEYSGCALDVFCWCNACGIYDSKWCPMTGFYGCAEGAKGAYRSCIYGCNSKLRTGQDISTCWNDCNTEFDEKIMICKDARCPEFCQEEGFTTGTWTTYTQEYGWDSCSCVGEIEEDFEGVAFPTDDDSDADGIPDIKDWCPYDEGPSSANGCPDGDYDGVPDDADKCPNEYGTWEYAGCKKTALDLFAEAPYKAKEGLIWFFSKQGEPEPENKKKMGFIKAIKNKTGVRVFRPGQKKWHRVGVHMPLYEGDRIRTLSDSKVKVIFFNEHDGTQEVIDISPNTLFETPGSMDTYKGERPVVHLIKGAIKTMKRRLLGKKPGFYVKTPTVCVGVRGTEFIVTHDPETGEDTVMVIEGEVQVNGTTNTNLEPGQQIAINNGELAQVQLLDEAKWVEMTEEDWDEIAEESSGLSVNILVVVGLVAAAVFFFKIRK